MQKAVDVYREMLKREMSFFSDVTEEKAILDCLETYWQQASEEPSQYRWPVDQRAARLIWAGAGFLTFGRTNHLEETLRLFLLHPNAADYKACRYYIPVFRKLLPMPADLSPEKTPFDVLVWVRAHRDQLHWDEVNGRFVIRDRAKALPSQALNHAGAAYRSAFLPSQPYIVLDALSCREQVIVDHVLMQCRNEGLGVLLPDTAFYEMSKDKDPFNTWLTALRNLSANPSLVFAGRSTGQMMKEEILTGKPAQDIVDRDVTNILRDTLKDLKGGDDRRLRDTVGRVLGIIEEEKERRERNVSNKLLLQQLVDHWERILDSDTIEAITLGEPGEVIRTLSSLETAATVYHAAMNDGCSDEVATVLALGPSMYGFSVYSLLGISLDWLAAGSLKDASPEVISEDLTGLDYTCTAMYCTGLVTKTERVSRVFGYLVESLERRWETIVKLTLRDVRGSSRAENSLKRPPNVEIFDRAMAAFSTTRDGGFAGPSSSAGSRPVNGFGEAFLRSFGRSA